MAAMTIAIIGAGLAGLACARALVAGGATVQIFDKGRTPGGRLATRRATTDGRAFQFDHGAQYITARNAGFAVALAEVPTGIWPDAGRHVPIPRMSALPRQLAIGLDLRCGCEIRAVAGTPGAWLLRHGEPVVEDGPFEAVLVAIPPPQAVNLLGPVAPALPVRLGGVRIAPCWTAMVAFAAPLPLPDTLRPDAGPIGWAARDSGKPGRDPATECWVLQATAAFSRARLEDTPDAVAATLLAALPCAKLPPILHRAGHRWRYAAVEAPLGEPCLWDGAARLGLAGDWCLGPRAEFAFDSGTALAAAILA